jgi:hypothetical protein
MRILALNLPQFHEINENNEWWGKGFTEWTNVKKAKPLYEGHIQPMIPLNHNYYDLSKAETINWQASLAKKYGISGFVYFHYWYSGRKLLEKPCEVLLNSPQIDTEYCFCWANHPWTRAWDGKNHEVLLEQIYGAEDDWSEHLLYLLPFFKDERYIKVDNKPVFVVYNASEIPEYDRMIEYWEAELKKEGFEGIYTVEYISTKNPHVYGKHTDAVYEDEPMNSARFEISNIQKAKRVLAKRTNQIDYLDYDNLWELILNKKRKYGECKIIQGAFPAWDNSPRRGSKGSTIVKGSSPEKFEKYLLKLLSSKRENVSKDFIIINAWNEWGEGAVLEPSEKFQYQYLEAVRNAVNDMSESI